MQQIADWLKTLGMSEYAERFAENDIDTSVLRDLTDQDFKELGVPLGHRRKMLRAIAELSCVAPTSPQACVDRAEAPRHCRTPPSHSDVLGPCRLDGALGPHGPGRPPRGHFGLSEVRRRDRAALWRLRRKVHGRWRPWSTSGIRKPTRTTQSEQFARGWIGESGQRSEDPRAPADARWYCDRTGGCRRSDRIRRFSGARQS